MGKFIFIIYLNMFDFNYDKIINNLYVETVWNIEFYIPKIVWALVILWIWIIIAIWMYKLVLFLFKKFKIIELIDRLNIDFDDDDDDEKENKKKNLKQWESLINKTVKLSQKIKVDFIVAKSISYYIFLVFFRFAIITIWIKEVEVFLWDLIAYLPSLFIGIVIGFFGIRFANFIYDVVYHTLNLTKQRTSRIIASWAKVIILFFTFMLVLRYIKIVDPFIINTILVWFISMLTIAWWLAFWLGWKSIAHEILESFRNKK